MPADILPEHLGMLNITDARFDKLLSDHDSFVHNHMHPVSAHQRLQAAMASDSGTIVIAVGFTEEEIAGIGTGRPALVVHVNRLVPGHSLPSISEHGFPIMYEEVGDVKPLNFQQRNRPVVCGVSVGPCAQTKAGNHDGGTIGCLVSSGEKKYILSNNHVLAYNYINLGSRIAQQSLIDGGKCPNQVVARLRYYVELKNNDVSAADAAIAECSDQVAFDPRILRNDGSLEAMAPGVAAPMANMAVQKSGRTTGHTTGEIHQIGLTLTLRYDSALTTTFENVFTCKRKYGRFGDQGDSGSVVTTCPENQPVGLLFGGSTTSGVAYCNRMSDTLSALESLTKQTVNILY
jgi:hypothetical protein